MVRKTAAVNADKLKNAIRAVVNDGISVRNTAKQFGVGRMSLNHHCETAAPENVKHTRPGLTPVIFRFDHLQKRVKERSKRIEMNGLVEGEKKSEKIE